MVVGGAIVAFCRHRRRRQARRQLRRVVGPAANDDTYAVADVVGDLYAPLGRRSEEEQREAEEEELEREAEGVARMREFSRRRAEEEGEEETTPKRPLGEGEEEEEERKNGGYAVVAERPLPAVPLTLDPSNLEAFFTCS